MIVGIDLGTTNSLVGIPRQMPIERDAASYNADMSDLAPQLYEPLNEYKSFGQNIGIVDGPFEYFSVVVVRLPLPFTTRMTVVRLGNGNLFLHSPIAFDAALTERLRSMGTIRHLVSPNQFHYAHIGEWSRAFPDAMTWASPRVRERARARGIDVQFGKDLGAIAPEDWRNEIDQTVIPGGFSQKSFSSTKSRRHSYLQTRFSISNSTSSSSHGGSLHI